MHSQLALEVTLPVEMSAAGDDGVIGLLETDLALELTMRRGGSLGLLLRSTRIGGCAYLCSIIKLKMQDSPVKKFIVDNGGNPRSGQVSSEELK